MDDASADLLHRLASRLDDRPWLVLVTRRDQQAGFVPRPCRHLVTLRPAAAGRGPRCALVQVALDDHPLPQQALDALAARGGGNPMFLEALVREAGRSGSVADLPESVEGLVTSQIDRLDPADRTVLRYAAVLGMVVDEDALGSLLLDDARRRRGPGTARCSGCSTTSSSASAGRLRFRHALMRDVAYEGLPSAGADCCTTRSASRSSGLADARAQCELLSLHFFHAGRFDRAWRYSVLAGERARAKFANGEAIDFFERAVQSAVPRLGVAPRRSPRCSRSSADSRFLVGLPHEAADAYAQARRQVRGDPVRLAGIIEKEARVDQRLRKLQPGDAPHLAGAA